MYGSVTRYGPQSVASASGLSNGKWNSISPLRGQGNTFAEWQIDVRVADPAVAKTRNAKNEKREGGGGAKRVDRKEKEKDRKEYEEGRAETSYSSSSLF